MTEIWKDIQDYENIYQVSNLGNIKSQRKIRKICVHKSGYNVITLYKNGKGKSFRVHRLVAQAFLPNIDNKEVINHINGIKTDNRVDNLEWCSQKENCIMSVKLGTTTNKDKRKKVAKLLNGVVIKCYDSLTDACRENKMNRRCLYLCLIKKQKASHGYEWKLVV